MAADSLCIFAVGRILQLPRAAKQICCGRHLFFAYLFIGSNLVRRMIADAGTCTPTSSNRARVGQKFCVSAMKV